VVYLVLYDLGLYRHRLVHLVLYQAGLVVVFHRPHYHLEEAAVVEANRDHHPGHHQQHLDPL
jgi:hypothetical protein